MKKLMILFVLFISCVPFGAVKDYPFKNVKQSVVFIKQIDDKWSATGVIIDPNGLVLTARHVIEDQNEVKVLLWNGTWLKGTVILDPNDIEVGLIRLPLGEYPSSTFAAHSPEQGDQIWTIGYPLDMEYGCLVSTGIVEGYGEVEYFGSGNFIVSDMHICPGNSGGPVLDEQGRIVGIVVGYNSMFNLSFFLSSGDICRIINR